MAQWTNVTTYIQKLNTQFPEYGQVSFPATQVPSADPNTLDDYEEGTCTLGASFGGGTTGITYTSQSGSYTKVGNRANVTGYLELLNKGSSTGAAKITGFPFVVRNNNDSYAAFSLRIGTITFTGQYAANMEPNTTTASFYQTAEAGTLSTLSNTNFANTSQALIGVTYQVA